MGNSSHSAHGSQHRKRRNSSSRRNSGRGLDRNVEDFFNVIEIITQNQKPKINSNFLFLLILFSSREISLIKKLPWDR